MEFRKGLLKAASLLALTAASPSTVGAAIAPVDSLEKTNTAHAATVQADPLFELMSRTSGSFGVDVVENALIAMFGSPSVSQVESVPGLLVSLAGLGAPTDVIERAKRILSDVVSAAPNLDEDIRESVLAQIEAGPSSFKLAQRPKKKRDPDEVGQVPGAQS